CLLIVVLATTLLAAPAVGEDNKGLPVKLITHKVKRQKLPLTIVERGVLDAENKADIFCQIKAPEGERTTVCAVIRKVLVEDGQRVKKGQLLIEFDSSPFEERLAVQKTHVETARLVWETAETNLTIVRSQGESDLQTAQVNLELAELDLEKYAKAEY